MKLNKNILLLLVILLQFSFTSHSDEGIYFHSGSYAEAKQMAKEQDKIIFIDGYTEWCGPCKRMSTDVFTDAAVGEYFNEHFVSIKLDMEKTQGMLVGRRYDVNFYPTLLFITPSGTLLHKEVGFRDKSELLKMAKNIKR